MADPTASPDPGTGTGVGPSRTSTASYPGTPRWVKVFGIVTAVLVLLVAILLITGVGGGHGPGRHEPSGDNPGGPASPSSVTEDSEGHTPPSTHTPPSPVTEDSAERR